MAKEVDGVKRPEDVVATKEQVTHGVGGQLQFEYEHEA